MNFSNGTFRVDGRDVTTGASGFYDAGSGVGKIELDATSQGKAVQQALLNGREFELLIPRQARLRIVPQPNGMFRLGSVLEDLSK